MVAALRLLRNEVGPAMNCCVHTQNLPVLDILVSEILTDHKDDFLWIISELTVH